MLRILIVMLLFAATTTAALADDGSMHGGMGLGQSMTEPTYSAEEQANLEAFMQLGEAFGSGDMETFMGLLDDRVEWNLSGDPQFVMEHGVWHGKQAVGEWLGMVDAAWETTDMAFDEVRADGDTVIVVGHQSLRSRETGKEISERFCTLLTYSNGKVTRFLNFDDSAAEQWSLQK